MYLKSLTLRGFKSFASATSLRLETGITCVVGPNGSGKSNIVDALCWVMGEQGAKSLRGGKMEDVVFAGTTSRPPLGRAEVTLTIDNSDGALPIDYAEVTISRLMFRSGQSEYAINGDRCRLLDVQELLSDSGLGREMHVIVGQGQLDTVLHAGPEARRALIEEAAGVLKHRRRKEKALRKLEAMQANLTRLVDLTAELGRRLKPLGRQAEVARRAVTIQADLRDSRLRLLADDYVTLAGKLEVDEADEAAVLARRAALETALGDARRREAELDTAAQQHAAVLARAQETWFGLSSLAERLRATAGLAEERHRHLSAEPVVERPGRDPDELDRQAAELREEEDSLQARLAVGRERLTAAVSERSGAEAELARVERRIADDTRAAATRADRLAKLRGQAGAASSRQAAAAEELERLSASAAEARARAERAQLEHSQVQEQVSGHEEGRAEIAAAHEEATALLAAAAAEVTELRKTEAEATRRYTALRARVEALQEAFRRGADASADLLAENGRFSGIIGPFAEAITVEEGAQAAIAAALGAGANAVAVTDLNAAIAILTVLRESGAGTAGLVIAGHPDVGHSVASRSRSRADRLDLPAGARHALDLVQATDELRPAMTQLLGGVVVAASLEQAADLMRATPGLRVVTRDGDVLGAHWATGGSAGQQSLVEVRAAADDAAAGLQDARDQTEDAAEQLALAVSSEAAARRAVDEARTRMRQADSAAAEISGRLGRLAGAARAAGEEVRRLETAIETARRAGEKDQARLAELTERLAEAEAAEQSGEGPDAAADEDSGLTEVKDTLAQRCTMARNAEMEARLEVRTVEERLRAIDGRADALTSAATAERQARERAQARLRQRAADAAVARAVARGATLAVVRAEQSLDAALARRTDAETATAEGADELKVVRARVRELATELDTVVSTAHGAEIARAEHRLRLEQMEGHAVEEFGVQAGELVADYGPAVPIPPPADAEEGQLPTAYDRATQERRAEAAQRDLVKLGKVNPLALEEYAALQERHAFLATQLEDLKKTRRDLLTVVKEVDDRVQEVFAAAYADTAREFEQIFSRLFPGGQGRLVLTEPDDMLATGIEVEARPPGKKVKRLSLLSGGERSLTAIAYLCAIFKARPSPFYVLDEVEAALDDTNLQRLLAIFSELRESSQLIVVTHQRRTMECADALYGVSMRGDGVSAVVSQRLSEREPA
ncbi:MAG TPA: chromosome segregation protein SMC [Streptosporangiaceae bacterium]|nr:chromosome segregation protein SMC [Streptosporangiaceae bacterium]